MKAVTVLLAFVVTMTLFANTSALLPPFAYTAAQAIMGKITEYLPIYLLEKGRTFLKQQLRKVNEQIIHCVPI